jgi:uncharacterized DUF497 family protein
LNPPCAPPEARYNAGCGEDGDGVPNWFEPAFEWDEGNVDHLIARHNIFPEAAEQVFFNDPHVRRSGETYTTFGRDDAGRYLSVVFVLRGPAIRVISARPMSRSERRWYDRHR